MSLQFRVAQADNVGKVKPRHGSVALVRLAFLLARHPRRVLIRKNDNRYGGPRTLPAALWQVRREMKHARKGTRIIARTKNGQRFAVVAVMEDTS